MCSTSQVFTPDWNCTAPIDTTEEAVHEQKQVGCIFRNRIKKIWISPDTLQSESQQGTSQRWGSDDVKTDHTKKQRRMTATINWDEKDWTGEWSGDRLSVHGSRSVLKNSPEQRKVYRKIRRATVEVAVKLLDENIFRNFGLPCTIVSDNGSQFQSGAFRDMCFARGIRHITTSPYYPNPSQAERFHRNLKNALIAYHHANHRNLDTNLTWLQLAFSTAEHVSHGRTPFELLLGYEPLQPINLQWEIFPEDWDEKPAQSSERRWAEALERLKRAHETVFRRYNRGARVGSTRTESSRQPIETVLRFGRIGRMGRGFLGLEDPLPNLYNLYSSGRYSRKTGMRKPPSHQYAVGPRLWDVLKGPMKLYPDSTTKWSAPAVIERFLTPVTVQLKELESGRLARKDYVSQFKPYYGSVELEGGVVQLKNGLKALLISDVTNLISLEENTDSSVNLSELGTSADKSEPSFTMNNHICKHSLIDDAGQRW
uniref:Integrase catalytic domain-containing protein n=1 Tax=Timema cristinae TaxID=61476 RepID=A0A7R9D689_TIMCR|nr:unnamed protein product [Timema cristinae]